MSRSSYRCEDCGHDFESTGYPPEIEDSPLACPVCGGLDIQVLDESESDTESEAA